MASNALRVARALLWAFAILSFELVRLCIADSDLTARIAVLEEQQQLDGGLARKLYDRVFRYSESKISKSINRKFKGRLKAAYGKTVQGKPAIMQSRGMLHIP